MDWRAIVGLFALLATAQPGRAQSVAVEPASNASQLADAEGIRKKLGLVPAFEKSVGIESIKVAVLDYGFEGVGKGRPYLPANAEVVEDYDPEFVRRFDLGDPAYRKGLEPLNRHGRIMAQIVWAVAGLHRDGPKFYLLNANGPTMLRRAVRFAIGAKSRRDPVQRHV